MKDVLVVDTGDYPLTFTYMLGKCISATTHVHTQTHANHTLSCVALYKLLDDHLVYRKFHHIETSLQEGRGLKHT